MSQMHRNKPGIRFAGKTIWVSELASIMFVCALFVSLLSVSLAILKNELAIHDFDREIAGLKAENHNAANKIDEMREMLRLVSLLDIVVGHKVQGRAVLQLADLIYKNSRQYGYNPELLLAVIAVESRFDPDALGRYRSGGLSGALGLMQIKYETAREMANMLGMGGLKRQDLFNPEVNVILGTAYLTTLITRFKSFQLGIIAYNLGPGTVRSTLSRKEALPMKYYEKVLVQYYRLKDIADGLDEMGGIYDSGFRVH
jgi:soluble lytic murein transglycosylase